MPPEVLNTIVIGALLAMFTAILSWQDKRRTEFLRREINTRFDAVRGDIAELKEDNRQIRAEFVSIHASIAQIALAVNPLPRPEAG